MTIDTATTAPGSAHPTDGPVVRVRIGQALLILLLAVCALVAVGTAFTADDPLPREGVVLVATFGLLAAVFGAVLVVLAARSRAARVGTWALPLFFAAHVALLGTWVPDAGFAVLAVVGALLLVGGCSA